jgi:hypothetical protein
MHQQSESPWFYWKVGIGLMIVLGLVGWGIVRWWDHKQSIYQIDVPLYPNANYDQTYIAYGDKPHQAVLSFQTDDYDANIHLFYAAELKKTGWSCLPGEQNAPVFLRCARVPNPEMPCGEIGECFAELLYFVEFDCESTTCVVVYLDIQYGIAQRQPNPPLIGRGAEFAPGHQYGATTAMSSIG